MCVLLMQIRWTYYASQIAETMQHNATHYELENWKGITASKCAMFTNKDISFVAIGRVIPNISIQKCLEFYDSLGLEYGEQRRSILVFDALIYNEDRHFGNFGILRDNHTGKIIAPAPIFDNGYSLMCFAGERDLSGIESLMKYAQMRSNPYNLSFEDICAEVMGAKQKEQLRHMIGFRFQRHPKINLPEYHLQMMEKVIEHRVQQMLAIPARRRETRSSTKRSFDDLMKEAHRAATEHNKKAVPLKHELNLER